MYPLKHYNAVLWNEKIEEDSNLLHGTSQVQDLYVASETGISFEPIPSAGLKGL